MTADMHEDNGSEASFPVAGDRDGEPVPDLSQIPKASWRAILTPLSPPVRRSAVNTVETIDEVNTVVVINTELELEELDRAADLRKAVARPSAMSAPAARQASLTSHAGRQLNVRLRRRDHAALTQAAELLDIRPTQLARTFIVNGTAQVLREHRQRGH